MARAVHVHLHRGDARTAERAPTTAALWEDLLRRMAGALEEIRRTTRDAEWHEDLHPRRSDGKFGHGQVRADQEPPRGEKPTSSSAKGGMDKVRELLLSGHPFTRDELLAATGLKDKRLGDYLAMLKNPKWAGPKGALSIERDAKGMYFVAAAGGRPAPLPPVVAQPPAAPADPLEARRRWVRERRDDLSRKANDLMSRGSGDMGGTVYQSGVRALQHLRSVDSHLDESRRASATDDYREMYLGNAERSIGAASREIDYGMEKVVQELHARKAREAAEKKAAPAAGVSTPDVSRPWFFKATSKQVAEELTSRGYVEAADFGRLDVTIANEVGKSLHEHMVEFPALRQRMDFTGSSQAFYRRYVDRQVEANLESNRRFNPGKTDDELRAAIRKRIKKPKVPGRAWALSHHGSKGTNAVTVNEKHATPKEMEALQASLVRGSATQWHPVGCDTVKSILDHELGHKLDELLGLAKHPEVQKLRTEAYGGARPGQPVFNGTPVGPDVKANMTRNLSAYAATNSQEFIAEAWSEYRNNPEPRPIARRLGEIVRSEYARQHPRQQEEAARAA